MQAEAEAERWDLLGAANVADPYPMLARLRAEAPVFRYEPLRTWAVSRYEDVVAVARNHADFSSTAGPSGGLAPEEDREVHRLPLISYDPPDHTRLRTLIAKAFTPGRVREMEPRIRSIAAELADALQVEARGNSRVDFVDRFASPLPVRVIAEMLGVPPSIRKRFQLWGDVGSVRAAVTDGSSHLRKRQQLIDYLAELVEERRRQPREDLISGLVRAADEERVVLSNLEVVRLCELLWIAGNETTTNLLSNALLVLSTHPEVLAALRADRSRIPAFVEETLRYDAPVQGLFRIATRDVELGGQKIRKGETVWMLFGSANRDPERFPDPDRFDLDRDTRAQLSFGLGVHFCLGATLARFEARAAFEALLERFERIEALPEEGRRIPVPILRGFVSLPVRLS